MSDQTSNAFYDQFNGAKEYILEFAANADYEGPFCDESGNIDRSFTAELAEEPIMAIDLGNNRFMMALKCMTLLSGLRLNWGDEFFAERAGNNLRLIKIAMPLRYMHISSFTELGFSNEVNIAKIVHSLGGGWETLAGGLLTITIPTSAYSEFLERARSGDH